MASHQKLRGLLGLLSGIGTGPPAPPGTPTGPISGTGKQPTPTSRRRRSKGDQQRKQ